MLKDLIRSANSPWTTGSGEANDVVLSSRIRLARNFAQYPFPLKQTDESGQKVLNQMADFCRSHKQLKFYDLQDIQPMDREVLVEKHLISPEHGKDDHHWRGLVTDEQGWTSIMVNEEDHLRLQCFGPGLGLENLWARANDIDNEIEEQYDYAFDENLGYLTCCPTNLGNGLRASVMMHLPGLSLIKRIGILNQLSNLGMTVRGMFGEGSQYTGDCYQISNQVTLGQSENDIITNLNSIARQIIKEERQAREILKEHSGAQLEDQVWRALGTLTHAKYISSHEALNLISYIRLGCNMGYLNQLTLGQIDTLFLISQPAYLQVLMGQVLTDQQRDYYRAERIGKLLQTKQQ